MSPIFPFEYALAGMALLPLLVGLLVWVVKEKQINHLRRQTSQLAADLSAEKRIAEGIEAAMIDRFKTLSSEALKSSSDQFLKLAEESFKRQHESADSLLKQREQSIDMLIKPITQALKKTEDQIKSIEKDRHSAFGSIGAQIKQMAESQQLLQKETRNLVTALRRPEVRGQWGELTLKRLAELAGMVEYCDFVEQQQSSEGMRPDMVVRMPDKRELVVDAKTPLDAYLSAIEAEDIDERDQFLLQHARNMRERVKELSRKAYWDQFRNSPDYVVLFIPGEQFLSAALEQDGKLLEDALASRVVLATPTTIIALLRAVAFGWRQMDVAENAERIQELGEQLYSRVATFVEHLTKMGKNLSGTVDTYNKAVGSLERQVLPGARKFQELGLQSKKEIPAAPPLESIPRHTEQLLSENNKNKNGEDGD